MFDLLFLGTSASVPSQERNQSDAATADVKRLILTHISGRYPPEQILAEAR